MSKQRVFELIREEQVILWVGAGLSKYAGYPLGYELGEILLNQLNHNERGYLVNASLADIAEEFIRYHNNTRAPLNRLLHGIFIDKKPTTKIYHEKIAKIPHLKTIVTTNYDKLFENSIKNLRVIHSNKEVSLIEDSKPVLFKIHGDPSIGEVIITRADYYKQIKEMDELVKAHLISKISTKSVLFLGYGFEDTNVNILFDNVLELLGDNATELFLVAPKLNTQKINYLNSKRITYIDSKAEKFINELTDNIRRNINADSEKGIVSLNTVTQFMNNHGMELDLKTDRGKTLISGVRGVNGKDLKGKLNLAFTDIQHKEKFFEKLSGRSFEDIVLTSEELKDINFAIQDVTFLDLMQLESIVLSPTPKIHNVSIEFGEHVISNVVLKVYYSQYMIENRFELPSGTIFYRIHQPVNITQEGTINVSLMIEHNMNANAKVIDEINYNRLTKHFGTGEHISVSFDNGNIAKFRFKKEADLVENSQIRLGIYTALRDIENHYNVRFIGVQEFTDEDFRNIGLLNTIATKGQFDAVWEDFLEFSFFVDEKTREFLLKPTHSSIFIQNEKLEVVNLFGKEIPIGYRTVVFPEPYISNKDEIVFGQNFIAKIKGRTGKLHVKYYSEFPNLPDYIVIKE